MWNQTQVLKLPKIVCTVYIQHILFEEHILYNMLPVKTTNGAVLFDAI